MNWIRGPLVVVNYISHRYKLAIILAVDCYLASIASVSVWFHSKKLPRDRIFRFDRATYARNEGKPYFLRVVWLSFLVLCSETARKCLLRRLPITEEIGPFRFCVCNNQSLLQSITKNIDLKAKPEKNHTESFCNKWKIFSYLKFLSCFKHLHI